MAKTRLNVLSYLDRSFFRFVTIHAFERQTDRWTEFSSLDRVCIACSAVKIIQTSVSVIRCLHNAAIWLNE